MPITASYSSVTRKLTVIGDPSVSDAILLGRELSGNLLVNGGGVPITGGPATIANTDLIEASGGGGDDTIEIDEANGPLPPASFSGGFGADTLRGGSGADTLSGNEGNDILEGRAGFDQLFGDADNDVLIGGAGNDQMFGGLGDDRMVWNPGDGSDLMEGDASIGGDTVEVNGDNGGETFTATANGTRVRFDRINPTLFELDIGTTEKLVVNMGGGNDSFSATGNLAALISITVDGGAGDDTILGSNGIDILRGGSDNDFVDGQQGNDAASLGPGNDTFQWDPGDGSDSVNGEDGADLLLFNGSGGSEIFELLANGSSGRLTRNLGNIVMDLDNVETVRVNVLGLTDTLTINDLSGTGIGAVEIDLTGTIGGTAGDAAADVVIVNATSGDNAIQVAGAGTSFSVSGTSPAVAVTNSEGASDTLVVNALGGNDTITATTLPAGVVKLTLDGGAGNDAILGSQGADVFLGGAGDDTIFGDNGNDTAFLGANNDVFIWDPGDGNDTIEGQDGVDTLDFRGNAAAEDIDISAVGGRIRFFRNVASVTMDLDDVETIDFDALGGIDNIVVHDLTGTDATQIAVHLAGSLGGTVGDGQIDKVMAIGSAAADSLTVTGSAGSLLVTGLIASLSISQVESSDQLEIRGGAANDTLTAATLLAGIVTLTLDGGLGSDTINGGAGADTLKGGDDNDIVDGNQGNDLVLLGIGNDVFIWDPGDGSDTVEGEAGLDELLFNGSNVSENIDITPNGARTIFFRSVGNIIMDLDDVEVLTYNALGGTDSVVVGNMVGTDVTRVNVNLASTVGGGSGDGQVDEVRVNGTAGDDVITAALVSGSVDVSGLQALTHITTHDATDRLVLLAGGGNDVVDASGLPAGVAGGLAVEIQGGLGDDVVIGSGGADLVIGGDGDDTALMGAGNDVFTWNPGDDNDTLEGQSGTDILDFNGAAVAEIITISANGGRVLFLRNVASVVMDLNDVETIDFAALGGADNIVINDISGTDVTAIVLDLAGAAGGADGVMDVVTINGTAGDNVIQVAATAPGVLTVSGLAWTVEIRNFDAIDRLIINALGGNDTIHGLSAGMTLFLNGGDGNDQLTGGTAFDTLNGGTGDDFFFRSPGGDLVIGGGGNDTMFI
jgi:Ca2+-binding RTX toxin-like protein